MTVKSDAVISTSDIMESGTHLLNQACDAICSTEKAATNQNAYFIWNSQSFARSEVIAIATGETKKGQRKKKQKVDRPALPEAFQYDADGNALCR